jgi:hypothetical protein
MVSGVCRDRLFQEGAKFCAELASMSQGETVKIGIGEIDFEKGEVVGESLGRLGHLRHTTSHGFDGAQRRTRPGANAGKLFAHAGRTLTGNGEQEAALGTEALQQGGGGDAGFFADVRESEAGRAEAFDHADGGQEELGVRYKAGAGRHARRL